MEETNTNKSVDPRVIKGFAIGFIAAIVVLYFAMPLLIKK